jgi:nucleoside-diphosphate-sugar epimerase
MSRVLITGGAGYIGSVLAGVLLETGHEVRVVDALLHGGDAILPFLLHPRFRFQRADVSEKGDWESWAAEADAVVHLAAIVGFPACRDVGDLVARRYNVESLKRVFEAAKKARRFIFSSTYSVYGVGANGAGVTEESPLQPQSLYAETKIEGEQYLRSVKDGPCVPVIFRFATLYGLSPRMRFDLIVNQFVLEAVSTHKLVIFQRDYNRSFVHIRDVVDAIGKALDAPAERVRGETLNLGSNQGNHSKVDIVERVRKYISDVAVEYRDLTFGGDMRDVRVCFDKLERTLDFKANRTVDEGIIEVRDAIAQRLIAEPHLPRYRNHSFIVQ